MWRFAKFLKELTVFFVFFSGVEFGFGQDCPADADVIEGPKALCLDDKGVIFSIPNLDGTTYEWILPDGMQGNSTTNEISIDVLSEIAANGVMYVVRSKQGCATDTIGQKVTTIRLPIITLEEKASICGEETYTVKEASVEKEKDYVWEVINGTQANLTNTNGLTPTYTPAAGDVGNIVKIVLKANTKDPCKQVVTDTLYLSVSGGTDIKEEIEGPRSVCENTTQHYIIPDVPGAINYEWEFPTGITGVPNKNECDITFGSSPGIIFVKVTTGCGLDTIGQKIIVVKNPVAEVEPNAAICAGESYTVLRGNVQSEDSFTWEVIGGNQANLQGADTPTPTYNSQPTDGGKTIQLVLKAMAKDPCVNLATDTLELKITTTADYTVADENTCPRTSVTLKIVSNINDPNITYDWYTAQEGGTSIFTGKELTIRNPLTDTTFWVEAVGGCGNERVPAKIVLLPKPTSKFSASATIIGESGEVVTFTDLSAGGTEGTWNFGLGQTAAYVPGENISYTYNFDGIAPDVLVATLLIKNEEGCTDIDTVFIDVDLKWAIYVPNIFTPNQDGLNDELNFLGYGINELEILIFNKWGEKVFESTDFQATWNGKNAKGNRDVSDGVYVYQIKAKNLNGEVVSYNGHVSLIR